MRFAIIVAAVVGLSASAADDNRVAQAQDLIRHGDFKGALTLLDPLIASEPKNIQARLTAAAACVALKNVYCGEQNLEAIEKLAKETTGYDSLRGRLYLIESDMALQQSDLKRSKSLADKAAASISKALAESPGQPKLLALHAMALRAARRNDEALRACEAWRGAEPKNPEAYAMTAAVLANADRWNETTALLGTVPSDDASLRLAIDTAVLFSGLGRVPWSTIQPLFDSVRSRTSDPQIGRSLDAFRTVLAASGSPTPLQMLDYLDADPADTLGVGRALLDKAREGKLPVGDATPPERVSGDTPKYPDIARRARIEGVVVVVARIRSDGSVGSVHVLRSSNPLFSDPAIASVNSMRFKPATKAGAPVEVAWTIRVDFLLRAGT
ncbi:MAG TPA: TonB family protein [Candidatus Polarisedimenticolaceae bacterium]|nr:TonB family protein [Candidatus Polarisedimenticolaceae bacterium]